MAAKETSYGQGVAMFQLVEEREPQLMHVAHLNNAIPVSHHHPVNIANTSTTGLLCCCIGRNWNETGVYDGKVKPQNGQALHAKQ